MATITEPRPASGTQTTRKQTKGQVIVDWITTTDHKKIGYLYLITTFIWFLIGGLMALVIRAQLALPGLEIVQTKEQYNQLFTMHGTIMLLLFATPLFAGFANVIMPVQIGAPDVAFPRLNALSYWIFTFGGLIAVAGFSPHREQLASVGLPMLRYRTQRSRRVSVETYGYSVLRWVDLEQSSVL
jgi:Heme/copper-type cytochrome/quinol oxidases, subunit 1